jgi:hypothetical protein
MGRYQVNCSQGFCGTLNSQPQNRHPQLFSIHLEKLGSFDIPAMADLAVR